MKKFVNMAFIVKRRAQSNWDNISEWWESPNVQKARKTFCDKYARMEKHPIRTMKRLLTAHE